MVKLRDYLLRTLRKHTILCKFEFSVYLRTVLMLRSVDIPKPSSICIQGEDGEGRGIPDTKPDFTIVYCAITICGPSVLVCQFSTSSARLGGI